MMDEYISKQQILKKAREHQNSPFGIPVIIAEIEKADTVKVIRCKDCRYWIKNSNMQTDTSGCCFYHRINTYEDAFCNCGDKE